MTFNTSFSHIDASGKLRMVDVGGKEFTRRRAIAYGAIVCSQDAVKMLLENKGKGDAFASSRIAGIIAAKKTSELIPLTHPLRLDQVKIHIIPRGDLSIGVISEVFATDRTGVEMEAMTAVSVALLNLYDMIKAVTKGAEITNIRLICKSGGKSGTWLAPNVQVGKVEKLAISKAKGTPKEPLDEAVVKEGFGLENDAHGGDWHRQVSLLALESIEKMQRKGLDVSFGSFAENIATSGIDLTNLKLGSLILIGEGIILEVTQIGKECHTRCAVYHRAGDCVMPREGIFSKVLLGGIIRCNDSIVTIP